MLFSPYRRRKLFEQKSSPKINTVTNAIRNRNPITFYYTGPSSPEEVSVKRGVRVRAEAVALGLSKKGNVIVRAYVQPPSVTKTGYNKTNWRTFIVSRMSNIKVMTDEQFTIKRINYKDGEESKNGPMEVTYVTSNWDDEEKITPPEETTPPEPTETQPETPVSNKPPSTPPTNNNTLKVPKKDSKPPSVPPTSLDTEKDTEIPLENDVMSYVSPKIKEVDGNKTITTNDFNTIISDLNKNKVNIWVDKQKKMGLNTRPGEGTRRKFEIDSNVELSNVLKTNNINVSDNFIQETIKRIKK